MCIYLFYEIKHYLMIHWTRYGFFHYTLNNVINVIPLIIIIFTLNMIFHWLSTLLDLRTLFQFAIITYRNDFYFMLYLYMKLEYLVKNTLGPMLPVRSENALSEKIMRFNDTIWWHLVKLNRHSLLFTHIIG